MPFGFNNRRVAQNASAIAKQRPPRSTSERAIEIQDRNWIVRTQAGGIPAAQSGNMGKGTCKIMISDDAGNLSDQDDPTDLVVYNLADYPIPENETVMAVQVGGVPIAMMGSDLNSSNLCKFICEVCGIYANEAGSCEDLLSSSAAARRGVVQKRVIEDRIVEAVFREQWPELFALPGCNCGDIVQAVSIWGVAKARENLNRFSGTISAKAKAAGYATGWSPAVIHDRLESVLRKLDG